MRIALLATSLSAFLLLPLVDIVDAEDDDLPVFEDITASSGIKASKAMAAWGDFNNDGKVDLYLGGRLYLNKGNCRFEDVTKESGLKASGASAVWGDFNNDGYLDLYSTGDEGSLWLSLKNGKFKKVEVTPNEYNKCRAACWGDINGDGYLDLWVANYEDSTDWRRKGFRPKPDILLINRRGKSFKIGFTTPKEETFHTRGVVMCDFDEDGDLDVYCANYRLAPNQLWINDGKGKFVNKAKEFGVAGDPAGLIRGTATNYRAHGHTIGACWGDFDNDTDFDLLVVNFSHPRAGQDRTKLLLNQGKEGDYKFKDVSKTAGIVWQESIAKGAVGDFDNDGFLDFYLTTVYKGDTGRLYRNDGDCTFTDVTQKTNTSMSESYQVAWADIDNDGDLDLLTGGRLLRNKGNKNSYLIVRLQAKKSCRRCNRLAVGAKVLVKTDKLRLIRQVECGNCGNQNDIRLHFGLGRYKGEVEIEITWPCGRKQKTTSSINRILTIKEK